MQTSHIIKLIYAIAFLSLPILSAGAQNAFPTFYESQKESYVKAMKLVFEDLHSRKWEKAQKDYDKMEEKCSAAQVKNPDFSNTPLQALYPLPQVAMAVLCSTEGTMLQVIPLDYDKAYTLLKQAITFTKKIELNAFLSDPDINVNLSMMEDRIESQLCQKASAAKTEKAYDAVIDSLLPQSLRLQDMKLQREDLAFANVSKSPTEAECSRYLEKYTDGLQYHRAIISRSLDSLRYSALDGSIASLQKYISSYPNSSYIKKAQSTLETLEYKNVKNTVASCRSFMEKYPSSQYTLEIKKRLTENAYKEAIAQGTAEAYQRYCTDFPYDLHYQNIFDSLLCKTVNAIYGTVFAGKTPDMEKVLSSSFYEGVQKREAAEKQLIEHSLVPPRRRNLWTGVMQADSISPFNHLDIKGYDIMSKTTATVHIHLTGPSQEADGQPATGTGESAEGIQTDIDLYFIFEGSALKLDDIRLDNGSTSQKQSLAC